MKITLRRAAQLQAEISRAMSEISFETMVRVSPVSVTPAATVRNQHFQDFNMKYLVWTDLNRILTQIRGAVGEANAALGVAKLLSDDAGAKARLTVATNILNGNSAKNNIYPGDQVWQAMYDRAVENQSQQTEAWQDYSVILRLLDETTIAMLKDEAATVRRQRNEISDRLLGINTNNTIEINEQDWTRLQDLGLV